jgi:hypothetical protein
VGVPVIALPFTDNPGGNPVAVHVYGAVPPVAVSAALYVALTLPVGSDVFVMVTFGAVMTTVSGCAVLAVCAGLELSFTVRVTE